MGQAAHGSPKQRGLPGQNPGAAVQPLVPEAQQPWGGPWERPMAHMSPLEAGIPSLETRGSRWSQGHTEGKQGSLSVRFMKNS